ncbi:MAG: hypothetical protein QOJ04_3989 [Caballeronia sp.]|nr:hypothetical protein [Caballeronia sp.]
MLAGNRMRSLDAAAATDNPLNSTATTRSGMHFALLQTLHRFTRLRGSQQHLYTILKSAVQVFAIRVVGAAVTYASMVFLARWLGSYNFGIYAYVFVIVTLLGLAFSAGFNSSTLRFASSYLARKKTRRLSGFLKQSYGIVLSLSLLGALLSAGLIVAFRDIIEPYYV